MKTAVCLVIAAGLLAGCASSTDEHRAVNRSKPGPAVGTAVGGAVGAVAGGVAGGTVAAGEGAAGAFSDNFNSETRIVRRWTSETTIDGRTIQVQKQYLVDEQGRVIREVY